MTGTNKKYKPKKQNCKRCKKEISREKKNLHRVVGPDGLVFYCNECMKYREYHR